MIRKASILWTLVFAICSFAQTTSDDGTASLSTTPASNLPSLADFAASATAPPSSNDVTPTTTVDTVQPDSSTDSAGQSTNTSSETDNTTPTSDETGDSSSPITPTSIASDTASSNSDGAIPTTTTDNTTQPTSETGQPDNSSSIGNIVQHTADEASVGADDALEPNSAGDSGTRDDTDQSSGETPDDSQQLSNESEVSLVDNATESNPELNATTETESSVPDSNKYPEGNVNASTPFPQSVIAEMSTRKMRYHHYLWHQVREGWNKFTPEVQQRFTELGWTPPRPARSYDEAGVASAIPDNDSGEDFLYMHREMIKTVNDIIARNNESYGPTFGWKTIPGPGDPYWPVPPNYTIPEDPVAENSSSTRKTDEFFVRIQNAERSFKDPNQLRNMSLGELGARMEVTIHAWLHMRFSENCSVGIRTQYLNKTNLPYIEKQWDDPQYNWLGDTYSSQLFPTFYKIHGWVDDRIQDWMDANNVTELKWNGTWTGGPWENVEPFLAKQSMNFRGSAAQSAQMDHSGNTDVLEQVMDVFLKSGVPEGTLFEDVKLDWAPWDNPE